MTICAPVEEDRGLDSIPCRQFGSAAFFVIHDVDKGTTDVIENESDGQSPGVNRYVNILSRESVDAVFVGDMEDELLAAFNSKGIKVYRSMPGTLRGNIEVLKRGDLEEIKPEID
ncbi:MAG: NifB/NifX family molybdenum-iron cluster-binding protein [Candidatus Krumholzibacteriota bacterium]|nr:NifB/NifX family molybdenum-iron cluster-binding protein [Candidatus Krumholzibacteriota bacterium]